MKNIILIYIKENKMMTIVTIIMFLLGCIFSLAPAKEIQLIIDKGFYGRKLDLIIILSSILLLTYFGQVLCEYITQKCFIEISSSLLKKLKDEIYNKLLNLDISFFNENESGYINSRIQEINSIDSLFSVQTLRIVSGVIQFLFSSVIIMTMSAKFLLISLIPIPILFILTNKSTHIIKKQIETSLNCSANYSSKINQSILGMETIKTHDLEEREKKKIGIFNNNVINSVKKRSKLFNKYTGTMNLLNYILVTMTYILGGIFFIQNDITVGEFISISQYIGKVYEPIFTYSNTILILQPAIVSLKRVSEIFFREIGNNDYSTKKKIDNIDNILFKNVIFGYKQEASILKDINFYIEKGDKVNLKGKNGSGKSTIIKLILNLYEVNLGVIEVNGINIQDIDRSSLIKNISYVAQRNFLFNDSISNNILSGIKDYDNDEYIKNIQGLGLLKIMKRVEVENNGKIGENGCNLSGGESQKIALARGMIQYNNFVILDEATTNLDLESKQYIKNYINKSNKTFLIVDHTGYYDDICNKNIKIN